MNSFFTILGVLLAPLYALNPIVIGGNMMFDSVTKERFYLKGITYGYQVSDSAEAYWKVAIDNIVSLTGVNTVRVYNIDPEVHEGAFQVNNTYDRFMDYCASKGLYVVVAITPPGFVPWTYCVLNRNGVPTGGYQGGPENCYPWCLLTYGQAVIRAFAKHANTLMFVVGNEVMNDAATWKAAPCVKGYLADLKSYMRRCENNMRYIPLMYAAADSGWDGVVADVNNRYKADYLTCGAPAVSLDIFGLNIYRWCSSECTFSSCTYQQMHEQLKHLPSPLILSEFGCRTFYYDKLGPTPSLGQRDWKQLQALYGSNMTGSWSGGTAYAYGVEGGEGFAFWKGGTSDFFGPPGTEKVCGFPGNVCNADNFRTQLGLIDPVNTLPVGSSLCNWMPPGYTRVIPACPTNFTDGLGVDREIPTRENADGFVPLSCPNHALSPIEHEIIACHQAGSPTPAKDEADFPVVTVLIVVAAVLFLAVFVGAFYLRLRRKQKSSLVLFKANLSHLNPYSHVDEAFCITSSGGNYSLFLRNYHSLS